VSSGDITEVLGEDFESAAAAEDPGTDFPAGEDGVTFTAKRFVLLGLCKRASVVIPSGQDSQQVLRNFLVEVAPGSLQVQGSDLELSVLAFSPSVATEDTGMVLLPARRLLALLDVAPESDVTVATMGDKAVITAGSVSWNLKLSSEVGSYPASPDLGSLEYGTVDREKFLAALKAVRHAIGRDGGRPPLMMVNIKDGHVTASDGARFQRAALEFPQDMQVPAAAVDHLLRIMGASQAATVSVAEQGNYLVFKVGATTFLSKKVGARFPDMERLMLRPAMENSFELVVSRDALAEAVRRVQINADATTAAIGLRLTPGQVTVTSRDAHYNAAEQPVEAAWAGPERLVVLNHEFLSALLASWPTPSCTFRLGPDTGKRKSLILLSNAEGDTPATLTGIIQQLHAALLGYA
jgi:DNA polymerase III subunit beta